MMFRKKKKSGIKKIPVNTDGDKLPEDVVRQTVGIARRVGLSVTKDIETNPELREMLKRETAARKQPGPEDVLLLFLYGKGAISPEKAILLTPDGEVETQMLYLYSDGYIAHNNDAIYVTILGMRRLQMIGAIDDKGEILPPFK
jgi:hypothetical protein